MERDTVISILATHQAELDRFGVRFLSLFGSVARGKTGPDSDVDILVEFERPVGLLTFVRLQQYLEGLLGRPVDLVSPDALKHRLRDRILREAVRAA